MFLLRRVCDILLAPSATWTQIATETSDTHALYTGYLMPLAALPALAAWIGLSVVGFSIDGSTIRLTPLAGLANALAGYVLTLLTLHLLAVFANRLAKSFGGEPDPHAALRLIAYASTAALLGGVTAIVPTYAGLGLAPTLYSAYTLARGIPVLMRSNPERNLSYICILLIGALVLGTINGAILAALR